MTWQSELDEQQPENRPVAAWLLIALGIVDLIATPVAVLVILLRHVSRGTAIDGEFAAILVGLFVGGITLGGMLIGLSSLVRHTHRRSLEAEALRRSGRDQPINYYTDGPVQSADDNGSTAAHGAAGWSRESAILSRLTDIRDLLQVGAATDAQAAERLRSNLQRNAAEEIIAAINARRLGRARELLRDAEAAYGNTTTLQRLHGKIDEAAARNEPLDYAFTRRVVEEAIADGQWDLAEHGVQALFFDHPQSARCRRLWDDTRRARLYAHIQARVADHHWAEALATAEEFLERFPASLEAEALRMQLTTLKSNAEILQRKQYETKFKELIGTHRYREALRIAKHVVEQFPDSPQAHALREQVPLLEKRVAG